MNNPLHITSGDCCGGSLAKAGLPGEVFVWHDILYDGPRQPGWPDEGTLQARAAFLERETGGAFSRQGIYGTLVRQYARLEEAAAGPIVLWFDACLFDMAMLCHILACLHVKRARQVELLCVEAFPGIEPYDGLGQLRPDQMASVYPQRQPVTAEQFGFALVVDQAFATRDPALTAELAGAGPVPLPWVPAAMRRWLQERPDPKTGLGRLEGLALEVVRSGISSPVAIMKAVSAKDTHPVYWGDSTLWGMINGLAERNPPLVRIEGPTPRLPRWEGQGDWAQYRVLPVP